MQITENIRQIGDHETAKQAQQERLFAPPDSTSGFLEAKDDFLSTLQKDSVAQKLLAWILALRPTSQALPAVHRIHWGAHWHARGAPVVRVESHFAAALMLSEAPRETLEELAPPWPCFAIRLPAGLIQYEGADYTHVVVHRFFKSGVSGAIFDADPEALKKSIGLAIGADLPGISDALKGLPNEVLANMQKFVSLAQEDAGWKWGVYGMCGEKCQFHYAMPLTELLGEPDPRKLHDTEFAEGDPGGRVIELAARLAVGVVQTLQTPNTIRRKSDKSERKDGHRDRLGKTAETTEYVLSPPEPVHIDCTNAVRAYLQPGAVAHPDVQGFERGHWSVQEAREEGTDRRRRWTQPRGTLPSEGG